MKAKRTITNSTFESCGYTLHVTHVERVPAATRTILMVNGAMSTAASFSWAIFALQDYNLVLFDSPCTGRSRQYNAAAEYPTRLTESAILVDLCEAFQPEFLCAMSWGGAATLLALSNQAPFVRKSIIGAFSFGLSDEMKALVHDMDRLLNAGELDDFSDLVNDTLGEFLPDRIKQANRKYLSALSDTEIAYLNRHFRQTLAIDKDEVIEAIGDIRVPTLFVNGRKDRYTSSRSVDEACAHITNSAKIEIDSGHFMAMEDKRIANQLQGIIRDYFQ